MVKQVLNNKELSAILQEVAFLLEVKGENPFKVTVWELDERDGWNPEMSSTQWMVMK